jgi:hypothetical protein
MRNAGGKLKRCCLLVRPGALVRTGPQAGAAQQSQHPIGQTTILQLRSPHSSNGALLIASAGCKVPGHCEAAVSAGCCHADC